jgi:hypothetical protein
VKTQGIAQIAGDEITKPLKVTFAYAAVKAHFLPERRHLLRGGVCTQYQFRGIAANDAEYQKAEYRDKKNSY